MKVLNVDPENPQESLILKASEVITGFGVVVYPTDTVYGIGCTVDEGCVRRVFRLKGRAFDSPLSVAFASIDEVRHYTLLSQGQEDIIVKEHKNGTTFIIEKRNVPGYVTAGRNTVGVRIPDSKICQRLIEKTGPLISTSANQSGGKAPVNFKDIDEKILGGVDIALDGGTCKWGKPSKVIDLTEKGRVLRG